MYPNPLAATFVRNFLLFLEQFFRGREPAFIVFGLISFSFGFSLIGIYLTLLSIVIFLNVIYNIIFISTHINVCISLV